MRILLLGEYSNVHNTLAEGLRTLGHEVVVASNGDFWKNYPRDIDLARCEGHAGGVGLMLRLFRQMRRFMGYDIVQLINPMFLELKAERLFSAYHFLRQHNRHVVLGAFGMDYYWVSDNITRRPLRYSDFNIGNELRTNEDALRERADWLGTAKERLNKYIAADADAIVAGLYEYQQCYAHYFPEKTRFIPFPIRMPSAASADINKVPERVRIFIGISRGRSEYKGTDIMLRAARRLQERYPERVELREVCGVPFSEYQRIMEGSDLILDQLYSYTPSMNPLLAMSKGIVCVGGGEEENYEILHEQELRPIINVQPTEESVYEELERVVLHPECIPRLKRESIAYVRRHHDYLKVAREYEELYKGIRE